MKKQNEMLSNVLESTNAACALLELFLMRSQCFISDRYTTPNVLYNFELISAVFASVKPPQVIKLRQYCFYRFVLNNRLSIMNFYWLAFR